MIIEVDEKNIKLAAQIHSESWKASHIDFCSTEFIELHSVEHQEEYLRDEMKMGKKVYMLYDEKEVGIVSIKDDLIENLYVLTEEQKKGYGTLLLKFAMDKCIGIPKLWILENNIKAFNLYTKYGFTKTGKKNQLSQILYEIEMSL